LIGQVWHHQKVAYNSRILFQKNMTAKKEDLLTITKHQHRQQQQQQQQSLTGRKKPLTLCCFSGGVLDVGREAPQWQTRFG
jgi:hypothetical protein